MIKTKRRPWQSLEREITPEAIFLERRQLLKSAAYLALGIAAGSLTACGPNPDAARLGAQEKPPGAELYPAARSGQFTLDRPLTDAAHAASFNNFYEFSVFKSRVYKNVGKFITNPWQVAVTGLVAKPKIFDIDELMRAMTLEERLYRFRCVEAWAMAVPWTGFALRELIQRMEPLSAAKYVRFVTFLKPDQAGNQNPSYGPWPYTEALSTAEAMNELTILATGVYGHPLPKQHGAPLRLVVPWKYGFKSIKSIVKIEFTAERPATFWNTNRPAEYDFIANVDPALPHPRWSQATEKQIDTGEKRPTLPFNGYGEWVGELYKKT
jgi:sulfoxide reductase catalytic subunit YedY